MTRTFYSLAIVIAVFGFFSIVGCMHSTGPGGSGTVAFLVPGTTYVWKYESPVGSGNGYTDSLRLMETNVSAFGKTNCFAMQEYDPYNTFTKAYYHQEFS